MMVFKAGDIDDSFSIEAFKLIKVLWFGDIPFTYQEVLAFISFRSGFSGITT